MTFDEIIKELKNKIYRPVYFLHGEEPYFIDVITNFIAKNVLTDAEKAFNQTILYGKDILVEDIDNAARRFPMMANHQVIIVKEAQNVKKIENLSFYVEKPLQSTILVINLKNKKLDKKTKLHKALEKNGVVFESKKLYDNQIPAWIVSYLKERKISIDPVASNLLAEYLGADLGKIANELDKLLISIPENSSVNTDIIEKNIGISKDYNNFELQNAIVAGNILKANRIIKHFAANPKEYNIISTISTLYYFFTKIFAYHFLKDKSKNNVAAVLKINPFFVKDYENAARKFNRGKTADIIEILSEYDMKFKGLGSNSSHGDLLKELIFKIMH